MRRTSTGMAWGAAALLVGTLHALTYARYVSDDAFVAFRYASRLISGHGLTWTDGPPVEGYSDLLWVLFTAGGLVAGLDPVITARGLGLAGLLLAIAAVSLDDALRPSADRAATGGLLLATSGGLAVATMGGLEHGFLAGLVAVALVALRRESWTLAALLWTAIVLLRADGLVLWGAATLGLFLTRREVPSVMGLPALAIAGHELARLGLYGDWLPATARADGTGPLQQVWSGSLWTLRALLANIVLTALAAVGLAQGTRERIVLPATVAAAWLAYVVLSGGDTAPGWQRLVPVLPALALLAAECAPLLPPRHWAPIALLALAPQWLDGSADHARSRSMPLRSAPLGEALRVAWSHLDPLLAVDSPGALPYYTRFRAVSMLGLEATEVWSRGPDLIAATRPLDERSPASELTSRPDFEVRYAPLRLAAGRVDSPIFATYHVRRDGALGPKVGPQQIEVPVWFFATGGAVASIGPQGRLGVGIGGPNPAVLDRLSLPPGRWALDTRPEGARLDVLIGGRSTSREAERPIVLELDEAATVQVLAWSSDNRSGRLRSFSARRTDDPATRTLARPQQPVRMTLPLLGRITGADDGPLAARIDLRGLEIPVQGLGGRQLELAVAGATGWRVEWRAGRKVLDTQTVPGADSPMAQPLDLSVPPRAESVRILPDTPGAWTIGRR